MKTLNLTQHPATTDQLSAGVVDLGGEHLAALKTALTFADLPSAEEIIERAASVAALASHNTPQQAMIGGALWLMAPLAEALRGRGIQPVYAFSKRVVVETPSAAGSVTKTAVFKHCGFVEG